MDGWSRQSKDSTAGSWIVGDVKGEGRASQQRIDVGWARKGIGCSVLAVVVKDGEEEIKGTDRKARTGSYERTANESIYEIYLLRPEGTLSDQFVRKDGTGTLDFCPTTQRKRLPRVSWWIGVSAAAGDVAVSAGSQWARKRYLHEFDVCAFDVPRVATARLIAIGLMSGGRWQGLGAASRWVLARGGRGREGEPSDLAIYNCPYRSFSRSSLMANACPANAKTRVLPRESVPVI